MNTSNTTDDWEIYNCHIHTFTRKHAPRQFLKWVLSDAKLGRVNLAMIPVYVLLVILYFASLLFLARAAIFLSARSELWALILYPVVLLAQTILVIPLFLFLILVVMLVVIVLLQGLTDLLIKMRSVSQSSQADSQLMQLKNKVTRGQRRVMRSNLLFDLLVWINPASNDIFERTARFLKIAEQPTQEEVFKQVQLQYPKDKTVFTVLPMDMTHMNLGKLKESIDCQHGQLLWLAKKYKGQVIPFYAADPRQDNVIERVQKHLRKDQFQGIKIYPSLGYPPDDPNLMKIYKLCIDGDFPVVTHCSPGGIWRYGLSTEMRRALSHPKNYKKILDTPGYKTLKLNLAHFGGAEEWRRHLRGRARADEEEAWVRTIYDMIASGNYPNLYTDISYTAFTPKVQGLYIDLVDYLKILLSHPLVRKRVLFGSDYYMVERESISEKEVSILLRSRLGEDLYKQIAYTNPREFLGIEVPAPAGTI